MMKTDPFALLNMLGIPDGVLATQSQAHLGQKLAIAASAVGKTATKLASMTGEDLDKAMPDLGKDDTYLYEIFLYELRYCR